MGSSITNNVYTNRYKTIVIVLHNHNIGEGKYPVIQTKQIRYHEIFVSRQEMSVKL